jgi:hypothetical protein
LVWCDRGERGVTSCCWVGVIGGRGVTQLLLKVSSSPNSAADPGSASGQPGVIKLWSAVTRAHITRS